MKFKRDQCQECGKKKTSYNKGRYCFACNRKCVVRDEALIESFQRHIAAAKHQLRILTNPARLAKEIFKNERMIEIKKEEIDKIKNWVTIPIEEEEEDWEY